LKRHPAPAGANTPWQTAAVVVGYFMKIILFVFCTIMLLATSGCIIADGRDHDDHDRDHWQGHDDHHGDWDHHDNR
jgi:hypothetical protein